MLENRINALLEGLTAEQLRQLRDMLLALQRNPPPDADQNPKDQATTE